MYNEFLSDSISNGGYFAFNTFAHMGEMKIIYRDYTLYLSLF